MSKIHTKISYWDRQKPSSAGAYPRTPLNLRCWWLTLVIWPNCGLLN